MKRFKIKEKSFLYTLTVFYLILLLMPVFSSAVIIYGSVRSVNDEVYDANKKLLAYLRNSIDIRIKVAKNALEDLAQKSEAVELAQYDYDEVMANGEKLERLMAYIRADVESNDFVEYFYIYLKKSDVYITSASVLKGDVAYKELYGQYDIDYDEYRRLLNEFTDDMYVLPLRIRSSISGNEIAVSILRNMRSSDRRITLGTTGTIFREDILTSLLNPDDMKTGHHIVVLDKYNNVLCAPRELKQGRLLSYREFEDENEIMSKNINGKRYRLMFSPSKEGDYKYVILTPWLFLSERAMFLISTASILTAVVFLISWIAFSRFRRRSRLEMQGIISAVSNKIGVAPPGAQNENERDTIVKLLEGVTVVDKNVQDEFYKQKQYLKKGFLLRLLKGTFDPVTVQTSLDSYGVEFLSERFAVIIFSVKEYHEFFADDKNLTDGQKQDILTFIITNITEELCGPEAQGYLVDEENMRSLIVSFSGGTVNGEAKEKLRALAEKAVGTMKDSLYIDVMASVSGIHSEFAGLAQAFCEALSIMEHQIMTQNYEVMNADAVTASRQEFGFSDEDGHILANYIKLAKNEDAKNFASEIFKRNFEEQAIGLNFTKIFIYNMVGVIIKAIDGKSISGGGTVLKNGILDKINIALNRPDISAIILAVDELIDYACDLNRSGIKHPHEDIVRNVNRYIAEHFSETGLSVAQISRHFYFSSAYLPRIYREHTGEKLLDYINKVRTQCACELLRDTDKSIKEIAIKTGFASSTVFIKAFKKYQGVTPGQYSQGHKKE